MKQGKNQSVEQTVRQLKTEQSKKLGSSNTENEEPRRSSSKPQQRTISRPNNLFKRF